MNIPWPRNILCSFHYYRDCDLDQYANLNIIGDSGAFSAESQSAKISTADLAGWAKQWRHRLSWVAALDVIGNPAATRRNWHEMVESHGIPGVPTIHFGANPKELDYYAAREVDFVGLGGMVGKHTAKQMRWLIAVFRYARDKHPDMRFHGWGVTADSVLQLPFYSVDSSGWTQAFRFGTVILRDPHTNDRIPVALDGRGVLHPKVARLLLDHYGVNPVHAATSHAGNHELIVRMAALSASIQEQWFRRKHGPMAAPAWGWLGGNPGTGPNIHLAAGMVGPGSNSDPIRWAHLVGPRLHSVEANGFDLTRHA